MAGLDPTALRPRGQLRQLTEQVSVCRRCLLGCGTGSTNGIAAAGCACTWAGR